MVDLQRRAFLRGQSPPVEPATVPRPPYAQRPDERFVALCSRCGDCVRACPERVLVPGDGAYPRIDFSLGGCTLCGACATACSTGALVPGAEPFAWRVQVSSACLAERGVECRLCGDACDAGALRFVPSRSGAARLAPDGACCTGCGACVSPCPVGAITLA